MSAVITKNSASGLTKPLRTFARVDASGLAYFQCSLEVRVRDDGPEDATTNELLFAAEVASERSRDIAAVRSAYGERFGQAPPAWPSPQSGYGRFGSGMMGGYGQGGNGPGMMGGYGPGRNVGPRAQGSGPWYGPMMGQGDAYQMMMGGRSFWWGSTNVDKGFVPALMRLNAMEISMATIGLTSGDASDETLARKVLAARSQELSSLSKIVQ